MSNDKEGMISNAICLAVVELIGERLPITRNNLVDKLEHNRCETWNVIGKGANRDAAQLVRRGI